MYKKNLYIVYRFAGTLDAIYLKQGTTIGKVFYELIN